MRGLDYSLWRPPSPQWMRDQGFGFVCRYLAMPPNPKVIDVAEYDGLRAAGLEVVLVWEEGATDALGGYQAGGRAANQAVVQTQELGAWPCPVYLAVDFDASYDQQADVNAYLWGAERVLGGPELLGIYGGFYAVSRALDAGACTYAWQTSAWSGGQWDPRAQLRQLPGGTTDYGLDESYAADFGQVPGLAPGLPPPAGGVRIVSG